MRENGFTLIELLATIMILALIMTVAVPNVMSTIDKNKQSTYVESAKRMITLAEYEVRTNTDIPLPTSGNCTVILLKALDLTEFAEGPEGGEYDTSNSYVVIARSGSSYIYMATVVENFGSNKRGVILSSIDDLNKENSRRYVKKNAELTIIEPVVGGTIAGYNVTNIINS